MQEPGGDDHVAELSERLERLQATLDAQSLEVFSLRAELARLRPRPRTPVVETPVVPVVAPPEAPRRAEYVEAFVPPPPPVETPIANVPLNEVRDWPAAPPMFSQVRAEDSKAGPQRSLENRIGSQWFNRIGIVAILIGVAWFLKLAYDSHWIHPTPTGKIISGLLVGAGIVLWSERFRRKGYATFSYSLKAVGTGTLYMALWASFQIYHLLPASVAMAAMIGVTAWNAIMALTQDSELLAVYALAGGFATPALLSSGGNHETFLFSYILTIDVAVLLLLAKKPWQRLLIGCFPGTVIYFIGWYSEFFTAQQAGVTGLFVVLLASPFVAVVLVGKQREDFGEGLLAPLGAAAFLSLGLYSVLQDSGRHAWLPWGAVVLAVLYLLLMRVRRQGIAEAMHLAIAVIFLTIAIPLKAEGRWITIGWLAEGVALLWVAGKLLGPEVQSRVRGLMRWFGCIALALGVVESLIFWFSDASARAFWNARFATELSAVGALALAAWLARHPASIEEDAAGALRWPVIDAMSTLAAHVVMALAGAREVWQFEGAQRLLTAAYVDQLQPLSVAAFLMAYGAGLTVWLRSEKDASENTLLRLLALLYLAVGFVVMIVAPIARRSGPANVIFNQRLMFEVIGGVALAATAWMTWHTRAEKDRRVVATGAACLVAFNLLAILAGAHEIFTYFDAHATSDASLAEAATISGWLMVYAAILLAAGFWKRTAFVRWQGLGLLVFTIGKVFLYDMRDLSSGYRVLSFMGLGVLLMTVSFAYQKDWLRLREDDGVSQ